MRRVLNLFKTKKLFLRKAAVIGATAFFTHKLTRNLDSKMGMSCFAEEVPYTRIEVANENIREINTIPLGNVEQFEEGRIYKYKLRMKDGGYPIIVVKHEEEFYALYAVSPYDGCTDLSRGTVFGNKLLSPKNGCAYNITNGEVEYGPGLDNIPIFKTVVKDGQLSVLMPKKPPIKIRPYVSVRDYTDLRKVLIVGGSEAAVTCAETLRSLEFTGDITVITPDFDVPHNLKKMYDSIKHVNYDKLKVRQEQYLQRIGVNFIFGQNPAGFTGEYKKAMVITDHDLIYEFDACVIATNTKAQFRHLEGIDGAKNVSLFKTIDDHKFIREKLESGKVKKLSILGINEQSYQFISTLKREYPLIDITVVDENKVDFLTKNYGQEVASALKTMHKNRGVKFCTKRRFLKFDNEEGEIKKVNVKGKTIDTDFVVLFPNNFIADTELFDTSRKFTDNISRDEQDRVKVGFDNNSGNKRIFCAGGSSSMINFMTNERIKKDLHHKSVNEAMHTAYNVLGLTIPYQVIPYDEFEVYNNVIEEVGSCSFFTDVIIQGDVEKMDFTAFYAKGDLIYKVVGTNKKKDLQIYNEAMRLGLMPEVEDLKIYGQDILQKVKDKIKESKRSGCFRELIYTIRNDPIIDRLVWRQRERDISEEFFDPYGDKVTMREMQEEMDKDKANFFNKR